MPSVGVDAMVCLLLSVGVRLFAFQYSLNWIKCFIHFIRIDDVQAFINNRSVIAYQSTDNDVSILQSIKNKHFSLNYCTINNDL
jgi:hypothetical protein